jgi:hypothetical protein
LAGALGAGEAALGSRLTNIEPRVGAAAGDAERAGAADASFLANSPPKSPPPSFLGAASRCGTRTRRASGRLAWCNGDGRVL